MPQIHNCHPFAPASTCRMGERDESLYKVGCFSHTVLSTATCFQQDCQDENLPLELERLFEETIRKSWHLTRGPIFWW